jgi:hypothetical protein
MKFAPVAALLLTFAAGPARAQEPPEPRQLRQPRQATTELLAQELRGRRGGVEGPRVVASDANVQETQQRLQQLLQQYPPTLARVLALDPTLLDNQGYLEPYPALAQFLAQHPEVQHNHAYFFGQYRDYGQRYDYNDPRLAAIREVGEVLGGVAALIVFLTVVSAIVWIIRTVIEHRKWQRMSKTHVETHTRLMERLTSNDDLIAYMQSPAGQRFLNAAPIPVEGGRMLSAPFGRILWSVQAGVVVALLGVALIYASGRFAGNRTLSEAELPLFVTGAAAMAIGVGFFVSSFIAYGMSRRLGLLQPSQIAAPEPGTGPTR